MMVKKDNMMIGDLFLMVKENLPTIKWSLSKIIETVHR